jgi:hypothetical protein
MSRIRELMMSGAHLKPGPIGERSTKNERAAEFRGFPQLFIVFPEFLIEIDRNFVQLARLIQEAQSLEELSVDFIELDLCSNTNGIVWKILIYSDEHAIRNGIP